MLLASLIIDSLGSVVVSVEGGGCSHSHPFPVDPNSREMVPGEQDARIIQLDVVAKTKARPQIIPHGREGGRDREGER